MDKLKKIANDVILAMQHSNMNAISIDDILLLNTYYIVGVHYDKIETMYQNLDRIFLNADGVKEQILLHVWNSENRKLIKPLLRSKIFLFDSIWNNHLNYNNFECYIAFTHDNINIYELDDEVFLQILLHKLPKITHNFNSLYCKSTNPITISQYIKLHNIEPTEFIFFKNITPSVYKKLNIPIPKNMVDLMLLYCDGYAQEIFDSNTHELNNDTLNLCISSKDAHEDTDLHNNTYKNIGKYHTGIKNNFINNTENSKHLSKTTILKKILEYKIIPSEEIFLKTFHKYTYDIDKKEILYCYIQNGFMLNKNHIIFMISQNIDLSEIDCIDIKLNENDYFSLYIKNIKLKDYYNIFEKNIQKQIELRELFRSKSLAEAQKFMKKNNLRPDRYCMDIIFHIPGVNKRNLTCIINEYKCVPMSSIGRLVDTINLSYDELIELLSKNNINAEYMSQKY